MFRIGTHEVFPHACINGNTQKVNKFLESIKITLCFDTAKNLKVLDIVTEPSKSLFKDFYLSLT